MTTPTTFTRAATPPERELWLASQLETDLTVFTTAHAFVFDDGLDAEALAQAWDVVLTKVPLLCARFTTTDGAVTVTNKGTSRPGLDVVRVESAQAARRRREEVPHIAFDPATGPLSHAELIRDSGTGADTVAIAISHLAVDGYAWSMLLRELQKSYKAIRSGGEADDSVLPSAEMEISEDSDVWARNNMAALPHPTRAPIPVRQARPRAMRQLPTPESMSQLPRLALAAAAVVASHRRRSSRVVVDVPFLARAGTVLKTPATAMNVVPLAIDVSGGTVAEILDNCDKAFADARPHAHARSEQARRAHVAGGAPTPVADIAMNLIPFSPELRLGRTRAPGITLSSGPGDVPAVGIRGQSDGSFTVEVDSPGWDGHGADEASDRLAEQFVTAFTRLMEGELSAYADEPEPAYPDVVDLIESHVEATPNAPAIIDSTGEVITYRQLWDASGALALALMKEGMGVDRTVGVCAPRGRPHAVALLGVLRAGAAFVPLPADAAESTSRRRIIDTVALDAIVAVDVAADEFADTAVPVLPIPSGPQMSAGVRPPATAAHPGQLAYVIATSGSTGVPKPVAIPRGALAVWVAAIRDDYVRLDARDRVAQFAAVQFDASVEELFGALCNGAALVPRSDRALENVGAWLEECDINGITVLDLPTGYWHELVHALDRAAARLPSRVHTVIIGGEAASPQRLQQWRTLVGDEVRLVNTYGPTEATVVATREVLSGTLQRASNAARE